MELEQQEETVKKGGKGCRNECPPFIKDKAAPDNGKDIGDGEETSLPSREIDQKGNKEMVYDDLGEDKLPEIFHPSEQESVEDSHEIEKAYEIVEAIR